MCFDYAQHIFTLTLLLEHYLETLLEEALMKLISQWGFSAESWKGTRGEYWVALQGMLMIGYLLLPIYRPVWLEVYLPWLYGVWAVAGILLLAAAIWLGKGLIDLGNSLTPLPYPREDGRLIQTGMYATVRHPLYSGIILAAVAYAVGQLSLTHLAAALVLFIFFNFKANQEEIWLSQKYPDYSNYQQQVKKLLPWLY